MSMIGNFLLVSDAEIDSLLAKPELVHGLLARRVHEADAPTDYVDVDKAWHALHFLLTGTDWEGRAPLDFIANGGESVGDEDVGYGPARVLRSSELEALRRALDAVPVESLVERYDGAKMDALEIYPGAPGGWSRYDPRGSDDFGYYSGAYEELCSLVRKGANAGSGLLIWLS